MIASLACICGGIGEVFLIGAAISGIGWLWRKLRKHKHSTSCSHKHSDKHR